MAQTKVYDLEERTFIFSKRIIGLAKALPRNTVNFEFSSQIIRSGCSIGANYIEANEALGKKDFLMRMRISRKECKETIYWLKLIIENNPELKSRIDPLLGEAMELLKILSSIIEKSREKDKE